MYLRPLGLVRIRPDPNLEGRHLSAQSINKKMVVAGYRVAQAKQWKKEMVFIICQNWRDVEIGAEQLLLLPPLWAQCNRVCKTTYLAVGRIGHLRKERPKLAHVSESVRQAINVEQFRVETGQRDDGRVEPVAS